MRMLWLLLLLMAGCLCPCSEMHIVSGNQERTVEPGDEVQLEAEYGDWKAGPGRCGAHWYVNYVEGGTEELGTIDSCGRYQAPESFPPGLAVLVIEASEHGLYLCADCCPYGMIQLYPRAKPVEDEVAESGEPSATTRF